MKEVLPATSPLFVASVRLVPAGAVLVAWAASKGRPMPSGGMAWLTIAIFALLDGTAFHLGNARGHGDNHAWLYELAVVYFLDKIAEHGLGDIEIGNDAVFHGADGFDVGRGAGKHGLGFAADGEDVFGAGLDGDHGGLAHDNTAVFQKNQRIGCAQINSDIVGKKAFYSLKHLKECDSGVTMRLGMRANKQRLFRRFPRNGYKNGARGRI